MHPWQLHLHQPILVQALSLTHFDCVNQLDFVNKFQLLPALDILKVTAQVMHTDIKTTRVETVAAYRVLNQSFAIASAPIIVVTLSLTHCHSVKSTKRIYQRQ